MSKGDHEDLLKLYDATAVWLRDCSRKGDISGIKHAEARLKEIEIELAKAGGEHV
jgi:hypothetical protein